MWSECQETNFAFGLDECIQNAEHANELRINVYSQVKAAFQFCDKIQNCCIETQTEAAARQKAKMQNIQEEISSDKNEMIMMI